jgi:endonuclease/exonuclease/phosphatase family metal-dependent hydrolase
MWAAILATDFAERAEALAAEIVAADPDVVGLQEVSLFRYQTPGDMALGGTTPATTDTLDFLDLLMDELDALSANYSVAAQVTDFDLEVPIGIAGQPLPDDIRLTDHDVILVKSGVGVGGTGSGNYTLNLTLPGPGAIGTITVTRGWVYADVSIGAKEFRFVNTHLEPATSMGQVVPDLVALQEVQGLELRTVLGTSTLPLVVVGDLNSPADGSVTQTYPAMITWGLTDLWSSVYPADVGYTCCQAANLVNTTSSLDERIDVILFTNAFAAVSAEIVGEETSDMTGVSALWPSDHAGVWGVLKF